MVALTVLAYQQAGATTISDDFNRAQTSAQTSASVPNAIGSNYTIASGSWLIGGGIPTAGEYLQASASGVSIMIRNDVQTLNTGSNSFTLSTNVLAATSAGAARTGGLVFNYADNSNYNVVRFGINSDTNACVIQFVSVVNGANAFVETANISSGVTAGSYYTLVIAYSTTLADTFSYSLSTVGAGGLYSNTVTVAGTTLSDGYSGFYRNGGGTIRFDEYELTTVVPESASSAAILLSVIVVMVGFLRYRRRSR